MGPSLLLTRVDESDYRRRGETGEHTHGSDPTGFAPQSLPVTNTDVVGNFNQHTHGTEFYSTSSNFVLLNQFFAYAQRNLPPVHANSIQRKESLNLSPPNGGTSQPASFRDQNSPMASAGIVLTPSLTDRSPVSIVNVHSNEEALEPPLRPKSPFYATENQQNVSRSPSLSTSRTGDGNHLEGMQNLVHTLAPQPTPNGEQSIHPCSSEHLATKERTSPEIPLQLGKKRLEREYVRIFMSNLHHIHPVLDPIAFTARCEDVIWVLYTPPERTKDPRHFFALYNIVVAVGALIADPSITQNFEEEISLCMKQPTQHPNTNVLPSSRALSKEYFRKSRALLGDVFEACSLESAQTLLLISLYCQNSLNPHVCYMYCGYAVRTALAIGIARESMSNSIEDRKAARRIFWCIYSHEIEMSCSAGRRDSLGKPRNYQIELPRIQAEISNVPKRSELEHCSFAMINEMVHLAAILRRISKELYHDSKGLTLLQKSTVAKELDTLLDDWKTRLPEYLDFSQVSFREAEWVAKQKLVLHLRYLNARIVLHRLFLGAPMSTTPSQLSRHVGSCLDAARDTIRIMYDAYTNRHYFRTWWYNSTYTLYAGMVVLYIIMLGHTTVPSNELLKDVMKAHDILQSMDEAIVARRSANLIREGLEVEQVCVQNQQRQSAQPEGNNAEQEYDGAQGQLPLGNMTKHLENDFSAALFSHAVPRQDPALLASIIDPNLLQDFTAADKNISGLEFLTFQVDGLYPEGPDIDLSSIML
ncbi:hypothetical protein N5P37_011532 [Trichoderma harzianum]|nr:hypothetical protein N5P37_011532 [Trichoderma harzianum]